MHHRVAVLAALCVLGSAPLGCSSSSSADDAESTVAALTSGRIIVRQFGSPGAQVNKWGYDIKEPGKAKALKPELAKELFGDIGMNLLRVPVLAADAHPKPGVANIVAADYADDLQAIANVTAVNLHVHVPVFASLKLDGKASFPDWVKDGDGVIADEYSVLLEDYLAFMNKNGVTVDFLGVDNESRWNEGNITPAKYNAIVSNLKTWCGKQKISVPAFIAPENYSPDDDIPWLATLWDTNAKYDNVDHIGVHIYSKFRDVDYVTSMSSLASDHTHGKNLWDSELHWSDLDGNNELQFDDIKTGLLSTIDHFDNGYAAISWWAFQPRSVGNKVSFIMSEVVSSTGGANNLAVDDVDGRAVSLTKFNTRAFENDAHTVTVWAANFTPNDRDDQWTEIENQHVTAASYVQWSPFSDVAGQKGAAGLPSSDNSVFSLGYPANTITRVTVTVK